MILSKTDLLIEEEKKTIGFSKRKPFSAFSLDLRLGKLYRYLSPRTMIVLSDDNEISQEEFIATSLEEIMIPEEGVTLEKNLRYFWQPLEKISLGKGFCGEIVSRSSAARKGICVRSRPIDEYLHHPLVPYSGHPLCTIRSFAEGVVIHPHDQFSQLFIMDNFSYALPDELIPLLESGQFEFSRDGIPLLQEDIVLHGELVLTMDPQIKVYESGTFRDVTLDKEKPTYLKEGTFFISSSAEKVSIPPTHIGYVTDRLSTMTLQYFAQTRNPELAPLPFISHPNAPYIGPRPIFEATITFENIMIEGAYLYPGMKLSELCLIPLRTPLTDDSSTSRYNLQNGATLSK